MEVHNRDESGEKEGRREEERKGGELKERKPWKRVGKMRTRGRDERGMKGKVKNKRKRRKMNVRKDEAKRKKRKNKEGKDETRGREKRGMREGERWE